MAHGEEGRTGRAEAKPEHADRGQQVEKAQAREYLALVCARGNMQRRQLALCLAPSQPQVEADCSPSPSFRRGTVLNGCVRGLPVAPRPPDPGSHGKTPGFLLIPPGCPGHLLSPPKPELGFSLELSKASEHLTSRSGSEPEVKVEGVTCAESNLTAVHSSDSASLLTVLRQLHDVIKHRAVSIKWSNPRQHHCVAVGRVQVGQQILR